MDLFKLVEVVVFPGLMYLVVLAIFFEWYKRKLVARMQSRLGPTYTGFRGILQPLADFLKLLFKEDIEVTTGDQKMLTLVLLVAPTLFIFSLFFVPVTGYTIFSFEGDLLLVLFISSIASLLLYLVGWTFRSSFTKAGAARLLLQIVGFDIAAIALALVPAFEAESLCIATISEKISSAVISNPLLLIPHGFAFILFLLAQQADLEEDPFDIPHAETELVAGYITEISGRKLAFLDLFKDLQMVYVSFFTASLFFGVIVKPLSAVLVIASSVEMFLKALLVLFILFTIEAASTRIRIYNLLDAFWKYIIPLSFFSLSLLFIIKALPGVLL
ncbi:MAG: hypothetical protein DRJ63_03910 [Thermoprotei archaeon]|nr:MAG: hypothetical protein DRJ63_03910 [Thermoprotei archaeon]